MSLECGVILTDCRRCRLRFRAVKRAYFTLILIAMHAHPVRRRMGAGFLRPPTRPLRCALRLLHKNWKKSAVYAIIEVDKANRGCGKK